MLDLSTNMERIHQGILILMYHHIDVPHKSVRVKGLYVTPKQFDWQIGLLKRSGFEFINFKILEERLKQKVPNGNTLQVIITFDDGYADNYQYAYPILQRHNVTAVIYPVVGDIGKRDLVWTENDEQFPVSLMSVENIREMRQGGIEFGSHCLEHVHLDRLTTDAILPQLQSSKKTLESITGESVLSVAYPYGAYNQDVLKAAHQTNYSYGVTTRPGINTAEVSMLELHRYSVKGSKWYHRWQFRKQLQNRIKMMSEAN